MATEVVQADSAERADGGEPATGGGSGRRRPGWAELALALVAIAYGASQTQVWPAKLGWDESIYFSQVSGRYELFFSAPRARGITWLAWPLAQFTGSPHALRIYLTVVSAIALYLAYRIWFKVVPPAVAVLAAVLFGSLWISRFYGAELMPNLWVAFGAVAAVGGFLRLVRRSVGSNGADADPAARTDSGRRIEGIEGIDRIDRVGQSDRIGLVALPLGLAVAALMRPSDAAWVAAALFVSALIVPLWRNRTVLALIVVGGIVGAAPWVIEAQLRFGGVTSRLHRASTIQGGLGWYPRLLGQHWKTIDGPLLCRPCQPPAHPALDMYWIPVLAVLLIAAIFVARRSGQALAMAVTIAAGGMLSVSYLLLVGYSAPRFLLPAFAVLAVPAAFVLQQVLAAAFRSGPARIRLPAAVASVVIVAAVLAQLVAQQFVLNDRAVAMVATGRWYANVADQIASYGVRSPNCVVSGEQGAPVAYYDQCMSRNVGGHDGSITAAGLIQLARTYPVAVTTINKHHPPAFAKTWTAHKITGDAPGDDHWMVYISPPR